MVLDGAGGRRGGLQLCQPAQGVLAWLQWGIPCYIHPQVLAPLQLPSPRGLGMAGGRLRLPLPPPSA